MQYLLLIHADLADVPENVMPEYVAFNEELAASGALVSANQLQPPDTATTVSVRDGETHRTDGPFSETREVLAGYYLIEVDTHDDAIAWAAKIPGAHYGHIEVRPVAAADRN